MHSRALVASDAFIPTYGTFSLFFGVTWPVLCVVTPQAFPPTHRASGFGFVSAWSKLGALTHPLIVRLIVAELLDRSIALVGLIFTASWAVAITCCAIHSDRGSALLRVRARQGGAGGGGLGWRRTVRGRALMDAFGRILEMCRGPISMHIFSFLCFRRLV